MLSLFHRIEVHLHLQEQERKMEVYLIRHTSVDLPEPTCYGQTDLDVSATFEEEAAQTKSHLRGIVFDKVYCSPLRRAEKLASYCGFPDAERDDRLKEMNMGNMEMVPFKDIPESEIAEWYDRYMGIQMPGGESTVDVYNRMKDFFDELRTKPYRRVAVFYHGCAILCTRILLGLLPHTAGFDDVTPLGGIEIVEL